MPSLTTATSSQTLRMSASSSNVLGAGAGAAATRKERRKGSVSSLQQHYAPSPPKAQPLAFEDDPSAEYLATKASMRKARRTSYFDYYPERNSARTREEHTATVPDDEESGSYDSLGRTTIRESVSASSSAAWKGKDKDNESPTAAEDSFAFPPMRERERDRRSVQSDRAKPKHRSLAPIPHSKAYLCHDDVPTLRFSYSSTQTQVETPPQTPIESSSSHHSMSLDQIRVVVAAPISGVEAMDALVEGMDGSDDDELFKRLQISSGSTKLGVGKAGPTHHPLYAPPLPKPPPGIRLGGGLPRSTSKKNAAASDEDEDDFYGGGRERRERWDRDNALATRRSKQNVHYGGSLGRSVSSNNMKVSEDIDSVDHRFSMISGMSASTTDFETPTPTGAPSIDDIIRRHASPSPQPNKVLVPSISEIIRRNTPPQSRNQSRNPSYQRPSSRAASVSAHGASSNGHGPLANLSDRESEPEPLSPAEEAELMARSSIDSVAAEVQESLRAQQSVASASAPQKSTPFPSFEFSHPSRRGTPDASEHSRYGFKNTRSAGGSSIRSGTNSTSNGGVTLPSPFSSSDADHTFSNFQNQVLGQSKPGSQKEVIATYLRSQRITTLLKLTRRPHASPEQPLTVSLSDLGSPDGIPIVVFLGLGCVRYVMGLYDEMAECLGLRLITIDRWGLGRTGTPGSNATRGVPEWATVVDEVLDKLNIDKCSIMAHSAGAPYALSFASKYSERIVGDVCLLAPWVGGGAGGGYRWLKYVPNGLLKTAQAAEWKIQAWMIGKPPKITYEGIGYNVKAPVSSSTYNKESRGLFTGSRSASYDEERDETGSMSVYSANGVTPYFKARPPPAASSGSAGSTHTFSDYDDLEDFGGRFESRSTLEPRKRVDSGFTADSHVTGSQAGHQQQVLNGRTTKKKVSKGFLRIWKGLPSSHNSTPPLMPSIESQLSQTKQQSITGKKLRTLKSIGSLRMKASQQAVQPQRPKTAEKSPILPETDFDTTLGLDDLKMSSSTSTPPQRPPELDLANRNTVALARSSSCSVDTPVSSPTPTGIGAFSGNGRSAYGRAGGRRSVSFTTTTASYTIVPSPPPSAFTGARVNRANVKKSGESYQVALGNALIAASHAESSKGTHTDLLQILNHEQKPWGFSYARYPHCARVWYGDKDERIAENAVRWMEQNMGSERCSVKVVKGADHGLMYKTNVVVDVLEQIRSQWHDGDPTPRSPYGVGADPFRINM